jgi:hypothetical protein
MQNIISKKHTNAWILFGRLFGSAASDLLISAIVSQQANELVKGFSAEHVAATPGHVALAIPTYELFSKKERLGGVVGQQKALQRVNIYIPKHYLCYQCL